MPKYDQLKNYLINYGKDKIILTFKEVANIIGSSLPDSAFKYSQIWWSNDKTHSQAKGWLNAGYRTCNISQNTTTFIKTDDEPVKSTVVFKSQSLKNILPTTKAPIIPTAFVATSVENVIHHGKTGNNVIQISGYDFEEITFTVYEKNITTPFLNRKGKTVRNVIQDKHYNAIRYTIEVSYRNYLDWDISNFLEYLAQCGNELYKSFLNYAGEQVFCRFGLNDDPRLNKRGIYAYTYKEKLCYIGRCRDNFKMRFNFNYGTIQPINCFLEGQSTNCHMNSLMNKYFEDIRIYLLCLDSEQQIITLEKHLIYKYKPIWNKKKY